MQDYQSNLADNCTDHHGTRHWRHMAHVRRDLLPVQVAGVVEFDTRRRDYQLDPEHIGKWVCDL